MNKERLLKLADLLEADAANPNGLKFDLGYWGIDARQAEADSYEKKQELQDLGHCFTKGQPVPVDCGTAACAVGLAALSGAFAPEGFTYQLTSMGDVEPVYEEDTTWGAVERFFDLTDAQSTRLFMSSSYPESKGAVAELAVAKRIRGLCDGTYVVAEPWDDDDDGFDHDED